MKKIFHSGRMLLFLYSLVVRASRCAGSRGAGNINSKWNSTRPSRRLIPLVRSYNRCDLERFASFMADNVEFYHDQGGVTLGKADLTE